MSVEYASNFLCRCTGAVVGIFTRTLDSSKIRKWCTMCHIHFPKLLSRFTSFPGMSDMATAIENGRFKVLTCYVLGVFFRLREDRYVKSKFHVNEPVTISGPKREFQRVRRRKLTGERQRTSEQRRQCCFCLSGKRGRAYTRYYFSSLKRNTRRFKDYVIFLAR